MLEKNLNARINTAVRRAYPEVFLVKISDLSHAGLPDDLGCLGGIFFSMEVKTAKGRTTKIQDYTIEKIRAAGGMAEVVRSVEEALQFMAKVKQKAERLQNGNR